MQVTQTSTVLQKELPVVWERGKEEQLDDVIAIYYIFLELNDYTKYLSTMN